MPNSADGVTGRREEEWDDGNLQELQETTTEMTEEMTTEMTEEIETEELSPELSEFEFKIRKLKIMLEHDLITEDEFHSMKQDLLKNM